MTTLSSFIKNVFKHTIFSSQNASQCMLPLNKRRELFQCNLFFYFTPSNYRQVEAVLKKQSKEAFTWNIFYQNIALFVLPLMLIRVIVILCTSETNTYAIMLGSIFELVGADRIHSELTVFAYTCLGLSASTLLYANCNTRRYFQLVIVYCNQYLRPVPTYEHLGKFAETILRLPIILSVGMYGNVAFQDLLIFVAGKTEKTKLWAGTNAIFLLHSGLIIVMWTTWTFCVCFNFYYILAYFLLCCKILLTKFKKEFTGPFALKPFKNKNLNSLTSNYLLNSLSRHERLITEVANLDCRFWRWYFTYCTLISSSVLGYSLYIVTMTQSALFMKLFFVSVSLPPISLTMINSVFGSKPLNFQLKLHYQYSSLVGRGVKSITFLVNLKVTLYFLYIFCIFFIFFLAHRLKIF